MNLFLKVLMLFLAITGAVTLAVNLFQVPFGADNFWTHHGLFFLIFITLFPRLTLLFSSVATGGFLWWLSFIFAPRILVAVLATISYWSQNPVLVIFSWLIAFSGESGEKYVIRRRIRVVRNPFSSQSATTATGVRSAKSEAIETEYKRL